MYVSLVYRFNELWGMQLALKLRSPFFMAHDVGTTGDKATIWDSEGNLAASHVATYPTLHPKEGWAEQDPQDWWSAFVTATRELMKMSQLSPDEVETVSFSGQMMSSLPISKEGEPLSRSIIWMDTRSARQAEVIKTNLGEVDYYKTSGLPLSPTWSLPKIMWLRDNKPEIFKKAHRFLQAKDFIVAKLTGEFFTDYSDASLSGALNVNKGEWAYQLLQDLKIPAGKLPTIKASTYIAGELGAGVAKYLGLASGTKIVIGGGDGPCAAVGAGAVKEGMMYNYIGASSWISVCTSKPLFDDRMRIFSMWHLDPHLMTPTGTMQMAGGSYEWLKTVMCESEESVSKVLGSSAYDVMNLEAERVTPGSSKLLYLPYLMGERAPWWNPQARAVFLGLSRSHGRGHIIRAVIEGVFFNLKVILEVFGELGYKPYEMRSIGGGSKADLWRQIACNIYGIPLLFSKYPEEATSLGAAVAAMVAVGALRSFEDAQRLICFEERVEPNSEIVSRYRKSYELFKRLYLTLEPIFDDLAELSS